MSNYVCTDGRPGSVQTTREAKLLSDSLQTAALQALYRILLAPPALTTQLKLKVPAS